MSKTHRCPYCQRSFLRSLYRPQQEVSSEAEWQRRRRTDYHRKKIANEPEYHQVVWIARRSGVAGILITTSNAAKPIRDW